MVAGCGALVFHVAGVQRKECCHVNVRGAEMPSYAQAILNQRSRILSFLQNVKLGHRGQEKGLSRLRVQNNAPSGD